MHYRIGLATCRLVSQDIERMWDLSASVYIDRVDAGIGCARLWQALWEVGWYVGEGAIVIDPVIVQEWQPFFMTLGGAAAALAGLVFVAMSLHPLPILGNPLTRARAFAAASGFLIGVTWALIMLLPARTAPIGSFLLIAVGIGGSIFVAYQQIQIRKAGMNVVRAVLADILVPAPVAAGIVGLLQPHSEFPFVLLAIAGGVGIILLFSQSWSLVLNSITNADDARREEARSRANTQGSKRG
ncbi:MAG: hypothetical protein ACXVDA_03485 [Ktedonobacterales bacterium]